MCVNNNLDQPIPDGRSKEFKREDGGCNTSQIQKEGVNFAQDQAISIISKLHEEGMSRRQIAGKIGYSKAYVIAILKRRFWPKKEALQQEILKKLQQVKIGEPPNSDRDKKEGKIDNG